MSTASRLTEVLLKARRHPIPFDDTARLVLFSDCHRGDNSWADDFARNHDLYLFALKHYYQNGFIYFELGDGDELYSNDFFADIRDAHPHVFQLLKRFHDAKPTRLYMLYGNHDIQRADPQIVARTLGASYYDRSTGRRVTLFKGIHVYEGLVLKHQPSGGEILSLIHISEPTRPY